MAFSTGWGPAFAGSFIRIVDDRGRKHEWRTPPRRIVSLVPSDTYSLLRLGARDVLVGRTRYCVAPAEDVEGIELVGGTKDADVDRIAALAPDVVVANQEENSKRDIERLDAAGLRVLVSFPKRVADGVAHLARLARLLGHTAAPPGAPAAAPEGGAAGLSRPPDAAREQVAAAYRAHAAAEARRRDRPPIRAFVPIWMDPLMTVHGDTFVSDMLDLVGAQNVFEDRPRRYPLAADLGKAPPLPPERVQGRDVRYPRVTLDEVIARAPEIVLLPDEPHAFTDADAAIFRSLDIPAARRGHVIRCDGKDLMWYGARALEGLSRLREIVDAARP
ncbi:helical backbone metal receptor [Sorangium sp. So ce1000]|jgi:ABC-type Fe3+-hydroxamate transport system substrate-binding protein|uniref:helical backbone metal receptor n=1 Tax=Sorangium sp. So ce1000 TaxID=3133325 RepID=UPI003F617B8C